MTPKPILIAGEWREALDPAGTFSAVDPSTKTALSDVYPVSGLRDVERACLAGADAASALRAFTPEQRAAFLDDYADRIEARADALVELAARETGYPVTPRLRSVELPRTTNQLRQAAAAARNRSWCQATIDTKANIRSKYAPLAGPVAVFAPNNFPFAFNAVAGGDFAAAIAAGNPVIAKANTGHPGTSQMLAELALDALRANGMPKATVQLLYHTPPEVGFALVSQRALGASAFTGSKQAGLRLKQAADRAGKPIYLEMSSVNPVFILPGALAERGAAIAKELSESCLLGAGQFCTRPGLTILPPTEESQDFRTELGSAFAQATPGTLLGVASATNIAHGLDELVRHGATIVTGGHAFDGARFGFANTLLRVPGSAFLAEPEALQTEVFGSVNLLVFAESTAQMLDIAGALSGNLTGSIYSHSQGADDPLYALLEPILRQKVGRLLNDKMPTGVAVSPAMNHGGPYPATGHPGFTAVGMPASLLRFAALQAYDNVRAGRLPAELRDQNPTGKMWRSIDGEWSQGDVAG